MGDYSEFETRRQPWFEESNFNSFNFAIPMKTLEIYCLDPRASDIPQAVAGRFGDEVYPGEVILDEAGNRVGSARTLFTVTNAGGRAAPALMSVAEMDYLFQFQNVVVVHHSFCGTSSPDGWRQNLGQGRPVPSGCTITEVESRLKASIRMRTICSNCSSSNARSMAPLLD